MPIIGLTGGIGSGKSASTDYFSKLGAGIIDADVISRRLTGPDQPVLVKIRAALGSDLFYSNGQLNRGKVRALIFSVPQAKQTLECILHPLIKDEVKRALMTSAAPYQIVAVPLLLETKSYRDLISRVLVVDCDEETQRQRAMAHHGLSRAEVNAIMATQLPRVTRLKFADDVLSNHSDRASLHKQIALLHDKYLNMIETHVDTTRRHG